MQEALALLQSQVAVLFGATILLVVFFLIARIGKARQPVALAFALMPLLVVIAVEGAAAAPGLLP